MTEAHPSSPERRPTIRMIAARAGISYSSVAKALRHHPKISPATRDRVVRIARALGYRPDPQVAQLMHHLRCQRKPRLTSTIAALTNIPEAQMQPYHRLLIAAAKERADDLGYSLTVFRQELSETRNTSLQRILRGRGVEGVLVLPILRAASLANLIDWSQFSVVVANKTMLAPNFPRVVPHAFENMVLLCQNLLQRGYRRIGLVVDRRFDIQITHGFSGAVLWQQAEAMMETVRPLLYDGDRPANLRSWFKEQRPDIIITPGVPYAEAIATELALSIPGPIGFALTTWEGSRKFAGIDTHSGEIGTTAINLLHGQIRRGSRGPVPLPMEMMITGTWVDGPSVRRAVSKRRQPRARG